MISYHFNIGDSSTGPIGFCARIAADSEEEAVEKLIQLIPHEHVIFNDTSAGEYLAVYFNVGRITADDIDESEKIGGA